MLPVPQNVKHFSISNSILALANTPTPALRLRLCGGCEQQQQGAPARGTTSAPVRFVVLRQLWATILPSAALLLPPSLSAARFSSPNTLRLFFIFAVDA